MSYRVRTSILVAMALSVAACSSFPNSGPQMDPLLSGDQNTALPIEVIMLSPENIGHYASSRPADRPTINRVPAAAQEYTIARGDLLRVSIYEATEGGLFKSMQDGGNIFDQLRVEPDGTVLIPYAGRIKALGKTRRRLQQEIVARLRAVATEPEVQVDIVASVALVHVSGDVRSPGTFSLIDGPETILDAVNKAGGAAQPALQTDILLRRGGQVTRIPMFDLIFQGGDRPLQRGDDIVVEAHPRVFVSMGAVKQSGTFPLPEATPSLIHVLGQVGGLVDTQADPTGVFVFRGTAIAGQPGTDRPIVFVLNYSAPAAIFLARSFTVEAGDVVYVTNAPLYQMSKVIQLLIGVSAVVNTGKAFTPF